MQTGHAEVRQATGARKRGDDVCTMIFVDPVGGQVGVHGREARRFGEGLEQRGDANADSPHRVGEDGGGSRSRGRREWLGAKGAA